MLFIPFPRLLIPDPLYSRCPRQVLPLSAYTLEEKVHIGSVHLLPALAADHGLGGGLLAMEPAVLRHVAGQYTREAGVRELAR